MRVGEKIKALRKGFKKSGNLKGLSQEDLARLLGVNRTMVVSWEVGRYRPAMGNVVKLAEIFKKDIQYFQDDPDVKTDIIYDHIGPEAFPVSLRMKILQEASLRHMDFDMAVVVLLDEYFSQHRHLGYPRPGFDPLSHGSDATGLSGGSWEVRDPPGPPPKKPKNSHK